MARQIVLVAALLLLGAVDDTFAVKPLGIIVGGRPASLGEFPYIVSLRNSTGHFCGGSLISDQYVLTAAHCIVGVKPPFIGISVVTGTISLTEGEYHRIEDVVVHPNYVPEMRESCKNDIAIIKLEEPITPNAYQKPIPVASSDLPNRSVNLTVSGWGYLSTVDEVPASTLQTVTVRALINRRCQEYLEEQPLFDTHLCTHGLRGQGTCKGDSGGPLVYNGEVVGIASFVYPCALGMPDVYTRVSRYLDFINSIIKA